MIKKLYPHEYVESVFVIDYNKLYKMGYKGIINLIIISFPHMIFYIAAFLCLVSIAIIKDKNIINTNETTNLFNKAAPYINILLLWSIGFLSETVINLFLVQKCFII